MKRSFASTGVQLFVGGLDADVSDDVLAAHFAHLNPLRCKACVDRDTGKCRGFGFVTMPDQEAAEKAITAHDKTKMANSKSLLRVRMAEKQGGPAVMSAPPAAVEPSQSGPNNSEGLGATPAVEGSAVPASEPPKPKRQRVKVTEQALISDKGLRALYLDQTPHKLRGKGFEAHDARLLMNRYREWANAFVPALHFSVTTAQLEALGSKRTVQIELERVRNDAIRELARRNPDAYAHLNLDAPSREREDQEDMDGLEQEGEGEEDEGQGEAGQGQGEAPNGRANEEGAEAPSEGLLRRGLRHAEVDSEEEEDISQLNVVRKHVQHEDHAEGDGEGAEGDAGEARAPEEAETGNAEGGAEVDADGGAGEARAPEEAETGNDDDAEEREEAREAEERGSPPNDVLAESA